MYSAADAMVIPSRQDNLPNIGIEAHSCATPVIAFQTGGLSDIVEHKKSGYLAKSFDFEDLGRGIIWILEQRENDQLGLHARKRALLRFSSSLIKEDYIQTYKKILKLTV